MRTFISRIIAGPIAALVAWLAGFGLEVGADFETALTETATLLILAVALPLYGVVHRWIDRFANPSDAAKPEALPHSGPFGG